MTLHDIVTSSSTASGSLSKGDNEVQRENTVEYIQVVTASVMIIIINAFSFNISKTVFDR
jgi:hypothetical protein